MCVDVIDIARRDGGARQSCLHAPVGTVAILGRRRDVIGIRRHAIPDHLGVHFGAASFRVLVAFKHDNAGALAHHEPVAISVVGPRRLGRGVVESGRKGAACREPSHCDSANRAFSTAGDHYVGIVQRDDPRGIADCMRARGARRNDGVVRPLETMFD